MKIKIRWFGGIAGGTTNKTNPINPNIKKKRPQIDTDKSIKGIEEIGIDIKKFITEIEERRNIYRRKYMYRSIILNSMYIITFLCYLILCIIVLIK